MTATFELKDLAPRVRYQGNDASAAMISRDAGISEEGIGEDGRRNLSSFGQIGRGGVVGPDPRDGEVGVGTPSSFSSILDSASANNPDARRQPPPMVGSNCRRWFETPVSCGCGGSRNWAGDRRAIITPSNSISHEHPFHGLNPAYLDPPTRDDRCYGDKITRIWILTCFLLAAGGLGYLIGSLVSATGPLNATTQPANTSTPATMPCNVTAIVPTLVINWTQSKDAGDPRTSDDASQEAQTRQVEGTHREPSNPLPNEKNATESTSSVEPVTKLPPRGIAGREGDEGGFFSTEKLPAADVNVTRTRVPPILKVIPKEDGLTMRPGKEDPDAETVVSVTGNPKPQHREEFLTPKYLDKPEITEKPANEETVEMHSRIHQGFYLNTLLGKRLGKNLPEILKMPNLSIKEYGVHDELRAGAPDSLGDELQVTKDSIRSRIRRESQLYGTSGKRQGINDAKLEMMTTESFFRNALTLDAQRKHSALIRGV